MWQTKESFWSVRAAVLSQTKGRPSPMSHFHQWRQADFKGRSKWWGMQWILSEAPSDLLLRNFLKQKQPFSRIRSLIFLSNISKVYFCPWTSPVAFFNACKPLASTISWVKFFQSVTCGNAAASNLTPRFGSVLLSNLLFNCKGVCKLIPYKIRKVKYKNWSEVVTISNSGIQEKNTDIELLRPMEKAQSLLFGSTKDQPMPEHNRADTPLPPSDCSSRISSHASQARGHRNGNRCSPLGALAIK